MRLTLDLGLHMISARLTDRAPNYVKPLAGEYSPKLASARRASIKDRAALLPLAPSLSKTAQRVMILPKVAGPSTALSLHGFGHFACRACWLSRLVWTARHHLFGRGYVQG